MYYYHFDGLGSVVALSDVNSVLVERYTYDVFGRPTIRDANGTEIAASAFANPYLFTGRAYDGETGLYYYRARYYDYATGRFLQPDPTGYVDGLNLYSYCGNNPFNFLDPSGLCRESLFDRVMNVVGPACVPVALTCLAILYPPVGVPLLMLSGFIGGLYVGEGVITGTDIYGNPLSASQRVYRTAVGGVMIATSFYAAGQMQAAMQASAAAQGTSQGYVSPTPQEGTALYRVFGGEAQGLGPSYTTVNPASVSSFRQAAGLYPGNTGQFVLEGTLTDTAGVTFRPALPGPLGVGGGLPEVVVPNPQTQISITRVSGANPPF